MSDCIFCKIANHELESTVVYEDTDFMAFQDTNPAAPTHVLLIPKKHVSSVLDQGAEETMLGKMMALVPRLAKELGIADDGFRLVVIICIFISWEGAPCSGHQANALGTVITALVLHPKPLDCR